jgi:hypothetical protein
MLQDLLDTFVSFETHAQHFDAWVLLGTGLLLLIAGLVVWLAGITFARVISALVAGIVAFLAAAVLTGGSAAGSVLACATGLVLGAMLRRPVFAIAVTIFVACCVFIAASSATGVTMKMSLSTASADSPTITPSRAWQQTRTFAGDLRHNALSISRKQPYQIIALAIGAGLAAFIATMYFREFGVAFGCSALGTLMAMAGMIVLLLYKGAQPVEFISERAILVAAIFAGMILFGIIVQMLLMRPKKGNKIVVKAPPKRLEEVEPAEPQSTTISLKPTENWQRS